MAIEIDQIIRSKRKTIALIVRPDGSVIVRAPLRVSNRSILEFVEKNAEWIEKKRAQVQAVVRAVPKQYTPGEMIEYLGKAYPLEVVKDQKPSLLLEDGRFKLAESALGKAEAIFVRWYRDEARRILNERVDDYARRYGFRYQKVGITSARTRWGSCSATGALNFSWRLIMAPMEAVDYVVLHELVHTVFHDHSRQFWKRVEQSMPDYRERRKWLRRNGQRLLV